MPGTALQGWPFLVGRGRRTGYRTLLAPGPLLDDGQVGMLTDAVGAGDGDLVGDGAVPGGPPRVQRLPLGPSSLLCVYRTERLDPAGLTGADDASVADQHGRPLEILYGVACPDLPDVVPHPDDLDHARTAALETYRRFLEDERAFTVERSLPVALRSTGSSGPLPVPDRPAPPARASVPPAREPVAAGPAPAAPVGTAAPWLVLGGVAVAGVALAAATWTLVLRPSGPEVTAVRVEPVQASVADCGGTVPVALQGSIATDGGTRVTYHWEDGTGDWYGGAATVRVPRAGTVAVEGTYPLPVAAGRTSSGTVRLVVDRPGSRTGTAAYAVSCG